MSRCLFEAALVNDGGNRAWCSIFVIPSSPGVNAHVYQYSTEVCGGAHAGI
jgi:hypothetical protein